MDLEILKKKISTFRGEGGRVRKVSDELAVEILTAWEQWTGSSKDFYRGIGISYTGIGGILAKAKRLKRDGFPMGDFKEIKIEEGAIGQSSPCSGIEMSWDNGKLIRFQQVDQLIDFLKKVA